MSAPINITKQIIIIIKKRQGQVQMLLQRRINGLMGWNRMTRLWSKEETLNDPMISCLRDRREFWKKSYRRGNLKLARE